MDVGRTAAYVVQGDDSQFNPKLDALNCVILNARWPDVITWYAGARHFSKAQNTI